MTYKALATFDATPDQALGLTIQRLEDSGTLAVDDGAYLALVVSTILDSYAQRHVWNVKQARVTEAVKDAIVQQDAATLTAIGAAAKVDLAIAVPAEKSVAVKG